MGASDTLRQLAQAAMDGAVAIDTLTAENTTLRQTLDSRDLALAAQSVALDAARTRPAAVTVKPGETMTSIADVHGVTKDQVKAWNPAVVPTAMPVGSTVWLIDRATMPSDGPPPPIPAVNFSIDLGDLPNTPDEAIPETKKRAAHTALLKVDNLQHVRVFFGEAVPRWDAERLAALTAADSVIISTLSRDRAGIAAFLANTPDKFRQRPHQVGLAHGHEQEAQWKASGKSATWMKNWLDGNAEKADLLAAAPIDSDQDDLHKLGLHFSQHHDAALKGTREVFYGGQDFGTFGEDCYHYQTWLNQQDRYETPEELFGDLIAFCEQVGRPTMIGEWGGTRAKTDTTGERRAQAIRDGGAYLRQVNDSGRVRVLGANWWCAYGRLLDGVRLNHHLEVGGPDSPEVAAFRELAAA